MKQESPTATVNSFFSNGKAEQKVPKILIKKIAKGSIKARRIQQLDGKLVFWYDIRKICFSHAQRRRRNSVLRDANYQLFTLSQTTGLFVQINIIMDEISCVYDS